MNDNYSFNKNKLEYLFFFFMFFFPIVHWSSFRKEVFLLQFTIAVILTFSKRGLLDLKYIRVIALWSVIMLFQFAIFGHASFISVIGQIMFISYPFFLVIIFKEKIIPYFVNIIVFFTVFSFFLYLPSQLSSQVHSAIYNFGKLLNLNVFQHWKTSFIIYTWEPISSIGLLRNSSLFHEPGNYACHLALAIVLNIYITRQLVNKKNIIMFIGIITTISTAGYLSMYFIIVYFYLYIKKVKNKLSYLFILPFIMYIILISFKNFDFIGNKKLTKAYSLFRE